MRAFASLIISLFQRRGPPDNKTGCELRLFNWQIENQFLKIAIQNYQVHRKLGIRIF